MQTTNQRANALQTLMGVYLRLTDVAERVIEIMAHMGMSISVSSTNNAISALSDDSKIKIRHWDRP